jgi:hypothetical protein
MLNYISILMLLSSISVIRGADLPLREANEVKIQRYHLIATNPEKRLAIRISCADKLAKLHQLDLAAWVYNDILADARCETDLDWKILAAEGLDMCGVAYKGKAILVLMAVATHATATEEQKATARGILNELQSSLK